MDLILLPPKDLDYRSASPLYAVLAIQPRASRMLCERWPAELHPSPCSVFSAEGWIWDPLHTLHH